MSADLERGRQIRDLRIVGNGWVSFVVRCFQNPMDRVVDSYLNPHPQVKYKGPEFEADRRPAYKQFEICEGSSNGCPTDCHVRGFLERNNKEIADVVNNTLEEMRKGTPSVPGLLEL